MFYSNLPLQSRKNLLKNYVQTGHGGFTPVIPALGRLQIQGQPGLHSKTLSQRNKNEQNF
jgi:hypothetical protein